MKTQEAPDLPAGNPVSAKTGKDAFDRLRKAIKSMPIGDLIAINSERHGYQRGEHAEFRDDAECAIEDLAQMARLGDRDAMLHLVYLGCVIARSLADLRARSNGDTVQKSVPSKRTSGGETDKRPYGPGADDPHIEKDLVTLSSFQPDELLQILYNLEETHPGESAEVTLDDLICYQSDQPSSKPASGESSCVEAIVQKLAGIRINRHAGELIRQCAEDAEVWPIFVTALADGRRERTEDYVKSLNLGANTGLDSNQTGGRGGSRKLEPGSQVDFALDVYNILNRERTRKRDPFFFPADSNEPVSDFEWISRAARLPKLEKRPEVLALWHAAAMAYFDHTCPGEYHNADWPSSVVKRSQRRSNSPTHKAVRSAVSEVLRAGLWSLAKDPPTQDT